MGSGTIHKHGLLSTTALLDLYEVSDEERYRIESTIRSEVAIVRHPVQGTAIIRDQKPLSHSKLSGCLDDGLSPRDWCQLLNRKVFFWVERERVSSLLGARAYRHREHAILVVDTRKLVDAYHDHITLAPINTGSTSPMAHRRGRSTVAPLSSYPYEDRRARGLRVAAELCVDYAVPNIHEHCRGTYRARWRARWKSL
jgi:hypothetical protein